MPTLITFNQKQMSIEIKINTRTARVELLEQNNNLMKIKVDDRIYDIDLMHTTGGTFSILENGRSHNIELVPHSSPKKYTAYTLLQNFEVEVIDAEARYRLNRGGSTLETGEKTITSPMPGKVMKILVREGQLVERGEKAIVLSAMKMESEYRSPSAGKVRKIHVTEGAIVEGDQVLIEFE